MGFRKKKKNDFQEIKFETKEETADKIIFEMLQEVDDSSLTFLASKLLEGYPLILNFEELDIDEANKAIAFVSGVVYACKGEIAHVRDSIYLFGNNELFKDGSMVEFLNQLK